MKKIVDSFVFVLEVSKYANVKITLRSGGIVTVRPKPLSWLQHQSLSWLQRQCTVDENGWQSARWPMV
jgi:hypothetical protein